MPLSEHEQRILAELEDSLSRHDPYFAERVRTENVYRHAGRNCKWAALGFVAGLAFLVAFYSESVYLGLIGVAAMFVCAVIFERNIRHIGKASLHDLRRSLHDGEPSGAQGGIEQTVHGARDWVRSRFFRRNS